jgi:type IX secretion system PorP/SprF family membrane protein
MNKKLKYFTLLILYLMVDQGVYAQQLQSWSSFNDIAYMWNPGMLARYDKWELSATHKEEWIGFEGAPKQTTISFQKPFTRLVTTTALGVYVQRESAGPFASINGGLTYNYKIKPRLFGKRSDALSFGLTAKLGQYQFNTDKLLFFNNATAGVIDNTFYTDGRIVPNLDAGIFYISENDYTNNEKNHFFFGLAGRNLMPLTTTALRLGKDGDIRDYDIKLRPHILLHGGYRMYPFRSGMFIETNLNTMIASTKTAQAMASLRMEVINKYWLAGGAATNGELFVQSGFILDENTFMKSIVGSGALRIGAKLDFHLGSIRYYNRMGYELYIAYTQLTD